MRIALTSACLALFVAGPSLPAQDASQPPPGFRAIFNGRDLSGWHGLNPHNGVKLQGEAREANLQQQREDFANHWRVENGELVNQGTGPYATTDVDYGDIELRIEYRTVAKADSGIYLRGTPQVQIWDTTEAGGKWDRNADKGSGGLFNNAKGAPGQLPLVHADKPFGEWNAFRILQVRDRTWVWLNDQLVVDGAVMENYWDRSQPLPRTGPIMLQTHGGEIRWRNIFVRDIPADEAAQRVQQAPAANPAPAAPNGCDDPKEVAAAASLPPREKFHLYLLIGQSNMAGRGVIEKPAPAAHSRVLKFTKDQTWVPATDPLHFDKPIAGVGLGTSFGAAMADANPDVTIGLIPCAVGGTPLKRWQKGGDLYDQALLRAQAAMKAGELKGILWHQGEGDSGSLTTAETYGERLAGMVQALRSDLKADGAPFVAGELGPYLATANAKGQPSYWKLVNEQIHALTNTVPHFAVASAEGMTDKGDHVHFDTASLREFGRRYAKAMQTLQAAPKAAAR